MTSANGLPSIITAMSQKESEASFLAQYAKLFG